jgi:hypothetical protein
MKRGNLISAAVCSHPRLSNSRTDRGVAMLVTLFTLLLLSVVGLGMMYSTNMESFINGNYKDKQTATYAAMAGLQEARDRMRLFDLTQDTPAGRITPPLGLPSLTEANVIYIINPKDGETVAPWDPDNSYADTELCQERMLGLSGTTGVPCTTLPSGSAWYTVYNDSLDLQDCQPGASSGTCFWHLPQPLDFKWVRISLKLNNNTPVPVNGDATDSRQVCWDGYRQVVLTAGYGVECTRYGSVIAVLVTNPGTGYTSVPTVTIGAPPADGVQATATAEIVPVDGVVGSVTVVSEGNNYTSVPTVTIDAPSVGTQATAHVCTSLSECSDPYIPPGAPVTSVSITDPGTMCYASPPAVLFTGGGGSGAAATAPLVSGSTSCIAAWSVTGVCNSRRNETITGIGLTGGGGSGFSGTISFDNGGNIITGYPTIQNSGTGYTSDPSGMSGLTGCGTLTVSVTRGRRIASPQTITPSSGGAGYTSAPTVSFATGAGSANTLATATSTLGSEPAEARKVRHIIVDNSGSGYTAVPNVTISGGGGSGATATANVVSSSWKVSKINVTDAGRGYTSAPTVTLSGGGGSGATGRALLGNGANWGRIYLMTALAQTKTGARAMMQMEATTAISGVYKLPALTLDGPNPIVEKMPNSHPFDISGVDANSCGETAEYPQPAIGAYETPNADPPTHSVDDIIAGLPENRLDHYMGEGDTPSVRNVYDSLGETLRTPTGLLGLVEDVKATRTNSGNTVLFGSPSNPEVNFIDGDLTLNGNINGYGTLLVTGRLTMTGNLTWYGTVLVIGDGILDFGGGGNGSIVGTVLIAKIFPDSTHHAPSDLLASNGSPTINWNGGGGNSITYDHCWVDRTMSAIPTTTPLSLLPLKVLSVRTLPY